MKIIFFITLSFYFLLGASVFSQDSPGGIKSIINSLDTIKARLPVEKVYLHTDRSYYSVSDTLWFKAYVFEGPFLKGSTKSGILYADILDSTNYVIKRLKFPLVGGMTWGNIALSEKDFTGRKYKLRAYTRWMFNFDNDYVFEKEIYISGVSNKITSQKSFANPQKGEIDLQFLPEGGDWLVGNKNKIAFKAVGNDGRGVDVKGEIKDSHNNLITKFESTHNGMGMLEIQPKSGMKYRAILISPLRGKEIELPEAKEQGIVLTSQDIHKDSLGLTLRAIGDSNNTSPGYFLVGHARGVVCYAANVDFRTGNDVVYRVSKELFPSGVARFTLFDSQNRPLNERAVYIDHNDALKIEVQKEVHSDSVTLTFNVGDIANNPIESTLSIAVTDNGILSVPASQSNIISSILLEADLKGHIENPAYYLNGSTDSKRALDLLMLTQGWTGYSWKEVFNPFIKPRLGPEREFTITGKSTNILTGKPRSNSLVVLNSKNPLLYMDTVTAVDGTFMFKNIPFTENREFLVIAKNAKVKDTNVKIEIDDDSQRHLSTENPVTTWLADTAFVEFNEKKLEFQKKNGRYRADGVNVLDEVVVSGKKSVRDSKNRNGPGKADFTLNEVELKQVPEMSLLELFQKNVKGFRLIKGPGVYSYAIYNMPLKLVFDGTDPFYTEQSPEINFLETFKAKNVKGIEVMTSLGYVQAYQNWFSPSSADANIGFEGNASGLISLEGMAYAEITTYEDAGPMVRPQPGMQIVRTVPFSISKKFYNPKYVVAKEKSFPEFNPVVFWEPSLLSGTDGKATLNFYHKNKPGNYTLIIEGSDMNGNLGYSRQNFTIKE